MPLKGTYSQDELHNRWAAVYRGDPLQDTLNEAVAERILEDLDLPSGSRFLDAGCGTGEHTIRIAGHGYPCVGVDISENVLRRAAKKVAASGLAHRVSLVCHALEEIPFADASFDAVHCRGVLMHIPAWGRALANLCRVLKPGGRIVILENNHNSVEAALVMLVRRTQTRGSRLVRTDGGLEFWSEESGRPFLARIANVPALGRQLELHGVRVLKRMATEFWDVGRFPAGVARRGVTRWNQFYFNWGLPAILSSGNAIIGEKSSDERRLPSGNR